MNMWGYEYFGKGGGCGFGGERRLGRRAAMPGMAAAVPAAAARRADRAGPGGCCGATSRPPRAEGDEQLAERKADDKDGGRRGVPAAPARTCERLAPART